MFTFSLHCITLKDVTGKVSTTCDLQLPNGCQRTTGCTTFPSPNHLSPVIYFMCLRFTAASPRSETNLCLQGQQKRGSDLLDSTSFNPSPCLDCGLLERIDRNIWNMIVPSHSHIWSTIALALELQKHSSELKSLLVVLRPSLFSQHGINVLMGGSMMSEPRGKQAAVGGDVLVFQ